MKFSEKLQEVEKIVQKLEKETLPLEEALAIYEEGIKLIGELQLFLKNAEQKVLILSEDIKEEPFEEGPEEKGRT